MEYMAAIMQWMGMVDGARQGKRNAALLKQQGKVASRQSTQDVYAIEREYRQLAGRQAASMAENGGTYEGSNAKILRQSEWLAMLDELNTAYHGELQRKGLAAAGNTEARNSSLLFGTQALTLGSDLYTQNKTKPAGK